MTAMAGRKVLAGAVSDVAGDFKFFIDLAAIIISLEALGA
jgi:hypothetical protein